MIPRRSLVVAGPLALAACGRADETYFGRTDPPRTQRLVSLIESEPGTLDPAQVVDFLEDLILSLFEGLTTLHPDTGAPMAGMATHYQVTPDGLCYTFSLRGHPQPSGIRLLDSSDLGSGFSRGLRGPPATAPAQWSDGVPLTAHDFVYSWRRVLDPATAAPNAYLMHSLKNAEGVRALDAFTLEVELRTPAPFFLELVSSIVYCPVPRHAIHSAGRRWMEPGRMVSNGAFTLRARRPNDHIVLARNNRYHESGQVALDEMVFLIVTDATARLNLYRAGEAARTLASVPALVPTLRRRKDFRPQRAYFSTFLVFNTVDPPFDDVRLRYAFNMATDKRPVADLNQAGGIPAAGLVPSGGGYEQARNLQVSVDGAVYDVLSFNPEAARELLSRTAKPIPKRIEYLCGNFADSRAMAQVIQRQWRDHLGVEVVVITQEVQTWIQSLTNRDFRHVAENGSLAGYTDPVWFLDLFTDSNGYGTGWNDPQYRALLSKSKATTGSAMRMAMLAECERRLLTAMPILPYCQVVQSVLRKPFVKGLGTNVLNRQQFKYAWIDTNWKPQ